MNHLVCYSDGALKKNRTPNEYETILCLAQRRSSEKVYHLFSIIITISQISVSSLDISLDVCRDLKFCMFEHILILFPYLPYFLIFYPPPWSIAPKSQLTMSSSTLIYILALLFSPAVLSWSKLHLQHLHMTYCESYLPSPDCSPICSPNNCCDGMFAPWLNSYSGFIPQSAGIAQVS